TFRGWANAVEPDIIKLIRHTGSRALISTSPSHSVQLLGLAAKEKTGIPWIADFRDQWTGHPDFTAKKNTGLIHEMEQRVLEKADAVVTSAPCTKRDFSQKVSDEKIFVIENGYDEQDFSLIDRTYIHNHYELRIGYNGTTRAIEDPSILLSVVSELYQAGDITKDTLTLTFTGSADKKLFKPFTELIDAGIVNISGYLTHPESLARMAEMDVSLLLLTKGRDIYPAKVFEYMYIGNPVFSLSTPGDDLDRLITKTGSGVVVDYRNKSAVRDELLRFIEMKKQGKLVRLSPSRKEISKFSRKIIAQRFAELLEKISC
ncbi:glycosyltransferase, partial [bacterium]|nr:glycosyltransferase [bacterium]